MGKVSRDPLQGVITLEKQNSRSQAITFKLYRKSKDPYGP